MTKAPAEPAPRRLSESAAQTRARRAEAPAAPQREARAPDGARPLPPTIRERLEASFTLALEDAEVQTAEAAAELGEERGAAEASEVAETPIVEPAEVAESDATAMTTRERIVQRAETHDSAEAHDPPVVAPAIAPAPAASEPPAPGLLEPDVELEAEESAALAGAVDSTRERVAVRVTHATETATFEDEAVATDAAPQPRVPLGIEPVPIKNVVNVDGPTETVEERARAPPGASVASQAEFRLSGAPIVQTKLALSSPGDPLEREADAVAARVMAGAAPTLPARGRTAAGRLQCAVPHARGPPTMDHHALPRTVSSVLAAPGGGTPLNAALRGRIEPHLGADLGHVRIRQGSDAASAARDLHARAFTSGATIFLAAGSSPLDVALMAHESAHVAQQQTSPAARTTLMREVSVEDFIPDWILDGVRSTVRAIPGYILLTYIAGRDPLSDEPAPATPEEVVEALLTRGPFGAAVGAALQAIDVLGEVFDFVMEGLAANDLTLARLQRDIDSAWEEFSVTNGIAGNVAIVSRYVSALLDDVSRFVDSIVARVLEIVRSVVPEVIEPLLATPAIEPVWNLAKKVLHYDPLRGVPVEATTVEIIAEFLRVIGEEQRLAQMEERGTLQETADWLDTQFATFAGIVTDLGTLFSDALEAIQPENLPDLLPNLASLAQRAFDLVLRILEFRATLILKILELIKDGLLGWLSENAHSIPGFHLLTVILGQNPFTGEVVPRTAETLIKGFITLLPGGEATYDELAESGVIGSAAERIEGEISRLGISLDLITGIFLGIWDTLTLDDLLDPLGAFSRILALFGEPLARLIEFVGVVIEVVVTLVLRLMNFPSDLLASVINNTLSAIRDIWNDPVGFLLNMMEALKAGFTAFFGNIGKYLLDGLLAWLFRGLGKLGIRLPTDLSLASILDLVFQVLGLTAEHLWEKLAEHIGPEKVQMIRDAINRLAGAWTFIQDVEREGLPAIWRYIKDQLSSLWQTVLQTAMEWVMTQIITSGTMKLLSFLDPTFIMSVVNGCIALFNAVQAAIEYLRDMLEILNLYVGTLAQVAAGNIAPGAEKIEAGLAAVVPVAIGFLAYLLGIDDVPERIADIVRGVREVIDRAIDWLIEQALRLGAAALNALGVGSGGAAIHEPFDVAGVDHEIADDGTGELTVASGTHHPVSDIVQLTNLYNQYRALPATAPQTQRTAVIRQMIVLLKANPNLITQAAAQLGDAPNLGEVKRHGSNKGTGFRPAGSDPQFAALWELESEHVLSRAVVSETFQTIGWGSIDRPSPEDNYMHTVMIYRGAADIKTRGLGADLALIRSHAADLEGLGRDLDILASKDDPQLEERVDKTVTELVGDMRDWGLDALQRAKVAVQTEHATNAVARGKTTKDPKLPPDGKIDEAFALQLTDIATIARDRFRASL